MIVGEQQLRHQEEHARRAHGLLALAVSALTSAEMGAPYRAEDVAAVRAEVLAASSRLAAAIGWRAEALGEVPADGGAV